jgi:hypothetical protein
MNCEAKGEFFEEFTILLPDGTARCFGCRRVENRNGRKIGSAGIQRFALKESVALYRGPKDVILKASPTKPLQVQTILFPLQGRNK